MPNTVGQLIRLRREACGLSAGGLSSKADLSRSYVSKLESGELAPSLQAFSHIATALDLTPGEVFVAVKAAA